MKVAYISSAIVLSLQSTTVSAELSLPKFLSSLKGHSSPQAQQPMDVLGKIFPGSSDSDKARQSSSDGLSISDILGKEGRINIFAGFTRDIKHVSERLDDNSKHTTVLAPLNSAITKLPRKPWEDPNDYDSLGEQAYKGSNGEDRAYKNLRRFVESHVIPQNPWKEGEKVQSIGGSTIWWENKGDKKVIQPGDIEVSNIADKVAHGEVWVIKGCLNYKE